MNKIVGNNLKMLRKSKSMSQEQVADHLNISQSAYARMERGDSTSWANHFKNICELFGRAPEELVKEELGINSSENLFDAERQTERALMTVYRKIIKQYELQIKDLKKIIKYLNKEKKQN
ncbi:helix-turn-helix transcriptional regulator [Flavobacterium quisquiliarum]|jgi:transcriptional regulator with XRE-family HTH domain|uniref:Helix-turn-helix transcriptional regulator n=1 Tax=Flavobacterium quisquiliarum TaxID=1834436 RepID=A0ABV8W8M4_9FLAO|nr:helix-turn-helix transcriptional regulator [Flavobacterium quisquiliarum]MBW1658091.1 helix-turn-helix domain-containing protein [Flavobacterium quisquiliarum]NWK99862.1 XRE family transcriptional regulator [Flavobacterium collinsii]